MRAMFARPCSCCSLRELCLPAGLSNADVGRLEPLVHQAMPLSTGAVLFAQGDQFESLYAVRSGSLKTSVVDEQGCEQVVSFSQPGDLLGFDAMAEQTHCCSAVSLEDSDICRIPFRRLEHLLDELPSLRQRLMRLMSGIVFEDAHRLLGLGRKSSEARVAAWLLGASQSRARRDLAPEHLRLPMRRTDLANFLGMRLETMSRICARLHREAVIDLQRQSLDILDFDTLRRWAAGGSRIHKPVGD